MGVGLCATTGTVALAGGGIVAVGKSITGTTVGNSIGSFGMLFGSTVKARTEGCTLNSGRTGKSLLGGSSLSNVVGNGESAIVGIACMLGVGELSKATALTAIWASSSLFGMNVSTSIKPIKPSAPTTGSTRHQLRSLLSFTRSRCGCISITPLSSNLIGYRLLALGFILNP
ncbi:hypothetical protein SE18_00065 [Herpetosiphon geysericola]|uniref:Uncharacterized protein n=1 Tax=Herpetosiphon geysericola TaxID=70996 RepID=A0A0P6Z420_9CHLR|nr:hypothetical protein SE18_00065 [Herpetosiphon geysericola]